MILIHNEKAVQTKMKNNDVEFDIRDGLLNNQRWVLFSIHFSEHSLKYEKVWNYEYGMTFDEVKAELKMRNLTNFSDTELESIIESLVKQKYPLLSMNESKEICTTLFFDKMFEGQVGIDYTQDFVLSSLFPNFLCNGGNGYSPHDITDVFEAINRYINDRQISDKEIHIILKNKSDKDLKVIVEAFVNHRINILGRLHRNRYDMFDSFSRILKFGIESDKKKPCRHLSIEEYEQLKNEQIERYGSIELLEEQRQLLETVTHSATK